MTASLVVDALNMAAWTRRTKLDGLICHTDAGSQYTTVSYTDRIDELGVSASIGTVGDSFDNAMAESVMGIFKTELHRNPAVLSRQRRSLARARRPRDRHVRVGLVVQRRASSRRARRPHASRSRGGVFSLRSSQGGVRFPSSEVSRKPRPIQCHSVTILLKLVWHVWTLASDALVAGDLWQ